MDGPNPCLREPQSQQEDEKERRWTLIIIRFLYTTRQVTQTANLSHNYIRHEAAAAAAAATTSV